MIDKISGILTHLKLLANEKQSLFAFLMSINISPIYYINTMKNLLYLLSLMFLKLRDFETINTNTFGVNHFKIDSNQLYIISSIIIPRFEISKHYTGKKLHFNCTLYAWKNKPKHTSIIQLSTVLLPTLLECRVLHMYYLLYSSVYSTCIPYFTCNLLYNP